MFCSLEEAWGNDIYKQETQNNQVTYYNPSPFKINSAEKQVVQNNTADSMDNMYQIEHFESPNGPVLTQGNEPDQDEEEVEESPQTCKACSGNGVVDKQRSLVNFICGLPDNTVLIGLIVVFMLFFDVRITRRAIAMY